MPDITPFQKSVFDAISRIPSGRVCTYATVAKMIGCGSARAVGQALKRNPFAPDIPCHRVIRSDGSLGGYQGKTEGSDWDIKRALLEDEGVIFNNGQLLDLSKLWVCGTLPKS
ncbi:MAG: MGMT family protein [Spartobacteria bacterium]|nr:MGMT family protein [Spartobacteria bacterium]